MSPDFNIQVWMQNQDNFSAVRDISTYLSNSSPNSSSCPSLEVLSFAEEAIIAIMDEANDIDNWEDYFTPENIPPDCESFNYYQVGGNNWQCASIIGIHELFTVVNWDCIGAEIGIFHQPLYFQLPINFEYSLTSGSTATDSAILLQYGFEAFDDWYQQSGCNSTSVNMEQILLEKIKDEFENVGGNVTITPPSGFNEEPTVYKYKWFGYGNCN